MSLVLTKDNFLVEKVSIAWLESTYAIQYQSKTFFFSGSLTEATEIGLSIRNKYEMQKNGQGKNLFTDLQTQVVPKHQNTLWSFQLTNDSYCIVAQD